MVSYVRRGYIKLRMLTMNALYHTGFCKSIPLEQPVILVFHGVLPTPRYLKSRIATLHFFKNLLEKIAREADFVSPETYFQPTKKPQVLLSFDDGYRHLLDAVVPWLEQQQIPAIYFLTNTGNSVPAKHWPDIFDLLRAGNYLPGSWKKSDFRKLPIQQIWEKLNPLMEKNASFLAASAAYHMLLNPEEIRQLAACRHAFLGGHSAFHEDFTAISEKEARTSLLSNKQFLEQVTGKPVLDFAFPFDSFRPEMIDWAKDTGYSRVFAGNGNRLNPAIGLAERFTINPHISVSYQHACISRQRYA